MFDDRFFGNRLCHYEEDNRRHYGRREGFKEKDSITAHCEQNGLWRQGLSRVIRSRVLSLREMPFIESAKAAGASDSYIIIRHLVPNVFPVAMASMILAVPAAILTEAALSFLGFGDPFVPTWGKMLHEAYTEGAFGAFAWWYILPPGLAITFICLAFVFIGHALDEIVNPRLRRRR